MNSQHLLGALLALVSIGSTQAEVETGVAPAGLSQLEYLKANNFVRGLRNVVVAELGQAALQGANELRSVRFSYRFEEGSVTRTFPVVGRLVGWQNLRVEQYRVMDLLHSQVLQEGVERALMLAEDPRADPDERRIVEVRGRDLFVLSGPLLADRALALRLRNMLWSKMGASVDASTDFLAFHEGASGYHALYSARALHGSEWLRSRRLLNVQRLRDLGADPGAILEEHPGSPPTIRQRLSLGGEISTFERTARHTSVGEHSTAQSEQALKAFFNRAFNGTGAGIAGTVVVGAPD